MRIAYLIVLFQVFGSFIYAQGGKKKSASSGDLIPPINISLAESIDVFPVHQENATYSISLCADVPLNEKPQRVAHHQETGHVFLILSMQTIDSNFYHKVFGFYPKKGLPTLLFKSIRSVIKDNSQREYNAAIEKQLTRAQFDSVIDLSIKLSEKIYHINKYNCYDYALDIFNHVVPHIIVPSVHVKFPFPFGRGGSPAGLYTELLKLRQMDSRAKILIGVYRAPVSTGRTL